MNKVVLLLLFLNLIGQVSAKEYLVLGSGDTIVGKCKVLPCFFNKCDSLKIVVTNENGKTRYSGYEVTYLRKKHHSFIIRKHDVLAPFYQLFRLDVDGAIKVFDCKIDDERHIVSVEMENGLFLPVTEKIFNKWILPELLKKESFYNWYTLHGRAFVYPSSNDEEKLGGRNQPKVNRFIIKLITIYNNL
jgi:hypothetical protein